MKVNVELLINLGVLRKSMFNDSDWYVIYTANGPLDVSLSELTGENAK
jgi:hypothetical protein